jgi:hypothetical protein
VDAVDVNSQLERTRGLSVASILFGLVGGLFYWWVPFGMVLSLAGLVLGIIDCVSARRRSLDYRLAIIGTLLSAATLALDIVIALRGLEIVIFGGPQ